MEWLLTNGLGGFAMGSSDGIPRRRYHAFLTASLTPPLERVVLLAHVADRVVLHPGTPHETSHDLGRFEFDETPLPPDPRLVSSERGDGVRWTWDLDGVRVSRTLHLVRGRHACAVSYEADVPARFECAPLIAMRDFHALRRLRQEEDPFRTWAIEDGVVVACGDLGVTLRGSGTFDADRQWWKGFRYSTERDRGMDDIEDLFCPGVFRGETTLTLEASTDGLDIDVEASAREERARLTSMVERTGPIGAKASSLVRAADAFVVTRAPDHTTILAGYPWFADWGRDAMISLPGLLLVTKRFEEARSVLDLFRGHLRRGLIPNRFDDYGGEPHYNTVDASLWFVHACDALMRETGPDEDLLDACEEVLTWYRDGTDFGIG
ncbi:MAG: glycogen debranching enzyme N-terminal domain-containing protein, partial [Phycisphaerales bacterium]|nr:glycogen debranching enzyme N-terminal domain-containing protein [Phycisphaerales bacterium]